MYILRFKSLMKCLNEFYIDFFVYVACCLDMAKNPDRHRLGRKFISGGARRVREGEGGEVGMSRGKEPPRWVRHM